MKAGEMPRAGCKHISNPNFISGGMPRWHAPLFRPNPGSARELTGFGNSTGLCNGTPCNRDPGPCFRCGQLGIFRGSIPSWNAIWGVKCCCISLGGALKFVRPPPPVGGSTPGWCSLEGIGRQRECPLHGP